ncbi:30S ribosome-binding factor RbfA [Rubellimicrobium arenae]|uniref:30S ribosome-binding factor RbfA n=1 Tax=Rubellimicrobium arenae TaxID=2817372 RepID=UPI001B30EB50|nr:30S ribosome-binding factor RbfA [Rubellimicrobium arenae]
MSRSPSPPPGPSQRQLRVGELIRRTLSEILAQGDLHDPELEGVSITVGEVRASPDLRKATAYVLPLGGGNREAILAALRRNKPEIRHQIARSMALKSVPDLRFEIDETFDRLDAARRMFADERIRRDLEAPPEDAPE